MLKQTSVPAGDYLGPAKCACEEKMDENTRDWKTIPEISDLTGFARGTIWGWIADKKLVSSRAGINHRILDSDLEKTLERFYSDTWANRNNLKEKITLETPVTVITPETLRSAPAVRDCDITQTSAPEVPEVPEEAQLSREEILAYFLKLLFDKA
jgi:hypothetical protein